MHLKYKDIKKAESKGIKILHQAKLSQSKLVESLRTLGRIDCGQGNSGAKENQSRTGSKLEKNKAM